MHFLLLTQTAGLRLVHLVSHGAFANGVRLGVIRLVLANSVLGTLLAYAGIYE